jgi:hypothetical protein
MWDVRRMSDCAVCKVPVVIAPVQLPDGRLVHKGCVTAHLQRTTPDRAHVRRRVRVAK